MDEQSVAAFTRHASPVRRHRRRRRVRVAKYSARVGCCTLDRGRLALGASAIVRPRADWVSVLHAVYAPAADDTAGARRVLEAMRGVYQCTEGLGLTVVEHDAECAVVTPVVNVGFGIGARIAA